MSWKPSSPPQYQPVDGPAPGPTPVYAPSYAQPAYGQGEYGQGYGQGGGGYSGDQKNPYEGERFKPKKRINDPIFLILFIAQVCTPSTCAPSHTHCISNMTFSVGWFYRHLGHHPLQVHWGCGRPRRWRRLGRNGQSHYSELVRPHAIFAESYLTRRHAATPPYCSCLSPGQPSCSLLSTSSSRVHSRGPSCTSRSCCPYCSTCK